ncbi:MAG: sulfite exporter TauE/SafE family protein [Bacteroidota bacterium]|nr:sulfite exporter TauE/SafE family protein [Bacteroidota bacterium]
MLPTLLLFAIGVVSGLSSGLFGIGGALIGTPLLRVIVNMPPIYALATPLPVALPSAITGAIAYWRRGFVDRKLAQQAILIAVPMTIAGSFLTHWTSGMVLMAATAAMLITVAVLMLRKGPKDHRPGGKPTPFRIAIVSGTAGFIAGFLAIGGGTFLVPAFVRWLGVPMHQAIATSLVCVAAFAVPGTIVHAALGHIDWSAAFMLVFGTIPGSLLGAHLALRIKSRLLEILFGGLVTVFGAWFLVRTLCAQ